MSKSSQLIWGIVFILLLTVMGGLLYHFNRKSSDLKDSISDSKKIPPIINRKSDKDKGGKSPINPDGNLPQRKNDKSKKTKTTTVSETIYNGVVSGTVFNDKDQPIANANVALKPVNAPDGFLTGDQKIIETITDANGRFQYKKVAFRGVLKFTIGARHDEFLANYTSQLRMDASHLKMDVKLNLKPGHSLQVRVTDENLQPVSSAEIQLQSLAREHGSNKRKAETGTSDADGFYIFSTLPTGRAYISVSAAGFVATKTSVRLEGKELQTIDIKLKKGHLVSGMVIDDKGTPLPGAKVILQSLGNRPLLTPPEAIADANGAIQFTNHPKETHLAIADYKNTGEIPLKYNTLIRPVVPPMDNLQIVIARNATLKGHAIDKRSVAPLNQITMHLAQRPAKIVRDSGSITRMESIAVPLVLRNGNFEINNISPGDYTIKFIAPGYQPIILRDVKIKSPAENDLGTVELLEGSGIAGRILAEADNIPLANYALRLRSEDNKSRVEKTGNDGRFQFMGLNKGIYSLNSLSPDHINLELSNIKYSGEKLLDLGDLILKQGGTISGKVSLMDGSPLSNVRVSTRELIDKQPQIQHAMTDDEGNFLITALKSTQYRVSCEHVEDGKRNYDALEVDLSVQEQATIELVVKQDAAIKVQVTLSGGLSLEPMEKRIGGYFTGIDNVYQASDAFNYQTGEATSDFFITNLTPGEYIIFFNAFDRANKRSFKLAKTEILAPGENKITFNLIDQTVRGIIANSETSEPLPGCSIHFQQQVSGESRKYPLSHLWLSTNSDDEGKFELQGLQKESYDCWVQPAGSQQQIRIGGVNLQTYSGSELTIPVRLPPEEK